MEKIRCLISDIPQQILADIVQRIAKECKEIEVVDHTNINGIEELNHVVNKYSIDVLIMGMKDNVLPTIYSELMGQIKNLMIIGLIDDGRRAVVYLNNIGKKDIVHIITTLCKRE